MYQYQHFIKYRYEEGIFNVNNPKTIDCLFSVLHLLNIIHRFITINFIKITTTIIIIININKEFSITIIIIKFNKVIN